MQALHYNVFLWLQKTHMIYTGTSALIEAKKYFKSADINPWRIFVFKEFEEEFRMKKDMCVLYQIEVCCKYEDPWL